mmetsp:Transcript_12766/g.36085  ORF Transcript_12766/g.36085 Transcript_12766/m.36085 type:complete len:1178 (-) Transcript_12766:150-3683(-)|eukprot:CAMPEP_0119130120 /NCGR_PEP_ID=MMETSP1310-20130426/7581_1 /TAXON_ID=464262 /ORGANISM="Genus nov. species nov., Strain RCC2339" /LENGTH=1177 /DNA_ID=CAMNT_0007120597 /DNA_START=105 /DNA_END=3638 /DNA_ORIENTATION=-
MDHNQLDFLASNCVAGQTLLGMVARANAIIAEMMKLSEHIPPVFQGGAELQKFEKIIFDFKYMSQAEVCEGIIENSTDLLNLDHDFREAHFDILHRFYLLYESIWKYTQDLVRYYNEIEEGIYIEITLDMVLASADGKQLVSESIFLLGVMLILLDVRIAGPTRERMLISYLRYKGPHNAPHIDEVCDLLRSTPYNPSVRGSKGTAKGDEKRKGASVPDLPPFVGIFPPGYPASVFKRTNFPEYVIKMVIGRLRSDDIYNQLSAYPLPEHRSTALAQQSAMLYVILYFHPETMRKNHSMMREIVDKHFPDNWVVSYYLGNTVDLSMDWQNYPAAYKALGNTVSIENVTDVFEERWRKVDPLLEKLTNLLLEGILNPEFVLENSYKLLNFTREINVSLRWLILHVHTTNKKLRAIIAQGYNPGKLLLLLLKASQFEYLSKTIFRKLLDGKEKSWTDCKTQTVERMSELSDYFSGEKALTRVKRNENLQKWFKTIASKVEALDYTDSTAAGRKIQQLMKALEEVKEFHQIESSIQVKEFLSGASDFLSQMVRIANIKEQFLVTMSLVSDFSYGWQIVESFQDVIHKRIQKDPGSMLLLRPLFLKMSSILETPLVRIGQCNSKDLESVSIYYSRCLVRYARKVLEIVPQNIFDQIYEINKIHVKSFQELPTKVEKEKIRDYAQFDDRYMLSKITYAVSVFTEGMLAMESTLIGVVQVDPKQLLEDGIRKKLVEVLSKTMHESLVFNLKKPSMQDFETRLKELSFRLDGLLRSFEYVQDYSGIYGLKIWQEEFTRIVNYYVEQECNSFLKKRKYDWESEYQNEAIPIPDLPPVPGSKAVNFIGRLGHQILMNTDPFKTVYLDTMSAWYDTKSGKELIGMRTFTLLMNSINVSGCAGIDQWLCFRIVQELQKLLEQLKGMEKDSGPALREFVQLLMPTTGIPSNAAKLYAASCGNKRIAAYWPVLMTTLCHVGQMQLLRRQIATTLDFSCRLDSNVLCSTLDNLNKALMKDVKDHYLNPDEKPYPDEDVVAALSSFLVTTGKCEPLHTIYTTSPPIENISCILFLFVVSQNNCFSYDKKLSIAVFKSRKAQVDFTAFVVGIITFLKQLHTKYTQQFLAYIGQYIRSFVNVSNKAKQADFSQANEVVSMVLFLEYYAKYADMPRKQLEEYAPQFILDTGVIRG